MIMKDDMEEISPKKFDWFLDNHFGFGIRWDDWLYPLHLSIALPFITFTFGIGRFRETTEMPRITDQPCKCPGCHWTGTVWDCEGDIDGDGNLGCPECLTIIEVKLDGLMDIFKADFVRGVERVADNEEMARLFEKYPLKEFASVVYMVCVIVLMKMVYVQFVFLWKKMVTRSIETSGAPEVSTLTYQ